jgi:hypothetical protein
MAIASPMWYSPQSSSVSVDRELPGDMSGMDTFESGYSYVCFLFLQIVWAVGLTR